MNASKVFSSAPLQTNPYTALKDAEAAEARKDSFVRAMSQQLINPLAVIIGSVDLLKDCGSVDQNVHSLKTIRGQGRHLLELINAILDISRMDADRFELEVRFVCTRSVAKICNI